MPKCMAGDPLGNPSYISSLLDALLNDSLMDRVTPQNTCSGGLGNTAGREEKLPSQFFRSVWVFSSEGIRQEYSTKTCRQIPFMLVSYKADKIIEYIYRTFGRVLQYQCQQHILISVLAR